jgi:hypothetical protein
MRIGRSTFYDTPDAPADARGSRLPNARRAETHNHRSDVIRGMPNQGWGPATVCMAYISLPRHRVS